MLKVLNQDLLTYQKDKLDSVFYNMTLIKLKVYQFDKMTI